MPNVATVLADFIKLPDTEIHLRMIFDRTGIRK